jgi:hypothetical protein
MAVALSSVVTFIHNSITTLRSEMITTFFQQEDLLINTSSLSPNKGSAHNK